MAVTVVSCYFLPFLFFFFTQIAFPKSIAAFVLGISALSISCLILYFQMLQHKKLPQEAQAQPIPEPMLQTVSQAVPVVAPVVDATPPKITYKMREPILDSAKNALLNKANYSIPNTKAIINDQQRALASQKSLFTEELEKRTIALSELQATLERMQKALQAKESENTKMTKELEDLKFELYTLLRIESYVSPKEPKEHHPDANTLAAASF